MAAIIAVITIIRIVRNDMNSAKNTDRTLKSGGGNGSRTPSATLLRQRLGASPAPRMLTPYEIGLLRRSKREMAEIAGKALTAHSHGGDSAVSSAIVFTS